MACVPVVAEFVGGQRDAAGDVRGPKRFGEPVAKPQVLAMIAVKPAMPMVPVSCRNKRLHCGHEATDKPQEIPTRPAEENQIAARSGVATPSRNTVNESQANHE